jgi:hypothetical protein
MSIAVKCGTGQRLPSSRLAPQRRIKVAASRGAGTIAVSAALAVWLGGMALSTWLFMDRAHAAPTASPDAPRAASLAEEQQAPSEASALDLQSTDALPAHREARLPVSAVMVRENVGRQSAPTAALSGTTVPAGIVRSSSQAEGDAQPATSLAAQYDPPTMATQNAVTHIALFPLRGGVAPLAGDTPTVVMPANGAATYSSSPTVGTSTAPQGQYSSLMAGSTTSGGLMYSHTGYQTAFATMTELLGGSTTGGGPIYSQGGYQGMSQLGGCMSGQGGTSAAGHVSSSMSPFGGCMSGQGGTSAAWPASMGQAGGCMYGQGGTLAAWHGSMGQAGGCMYGQGGTLAAWHGSMGQPDGCLHGQAGTSAAWHGGYQATASMTGSASACGVGRSRR